MVLSIGTVASVRIVRSSRETARIRSISWKCSRRISPRSRAPGGDHVVDTSAQILEHEILLGGRLAVVDLLSPALDRQLDTERLVDGKGDVEEVEAVDAEVVDGVALQLDAVARDVVAGFGDDGGDGVEGRGHRQPLNAFSARARPLAEVRN